LARQKAFSIYSDVALGCNNVGKSFGTTFGMVKAKYVEWYRIMLKAT